jgi:hypothetical protein
MVWVRALAGRLKSDYRYSALMCYNTFPAPKFSESIVDRLSLSGFEILKARELYPDQSMAKLYDPELMPEELKYAHEKNDALVDSLYLKSGFKDDIHRLELLFKLYEKLIEGKNA